MKQLLIGVAVGILVAMTGLLGMGGLAYADTTEAGTYGSGDYGSCSYGSCTITLTSGGSVSLDVTPTGSGKCTVHSDTASVETSNSAGYTLTMTVDAADSSMTGTNGTIPALSSTAASPAVLTMNTWGYRVEGIAGFGTEATSAQDDAAVPGTTFAGVPSSAGAGTPVASSDAPASPAEATTVWYGVCANTSQAAGTYAATVLYTAVAN